MSSKKLPPGYELALARQQRRLAVIEFVGELVDEDHEFALEIQTILNTMLNGEKPARSRSTGKKTVFERIKQFYIANRNKWQTAPDIMQGAKLSRGAVSHTLYKAHKELFQQKDHPTDGKMKLWRFKPDVWRREVLS